MVQYIDKNALIAKIDNLKHKIDDRYSYSNGWKDALRMLEAELDTLEVKGFKLPNPRFPHLNNIVDKVFGTGNLESFEYEEAKQLVLLAKEELLKDLEVKEVDLEREIDGELKTRWMGEYLNTEKFYESAKHFFELGLKSQKRK